MPIRMVLLALALASIGASCRPASTDDAPAAERRDAGAQDVPSSELDAAARDVVAFLRGEAPALRVALADTVLLLVSPEGGGGRTRIPRAELERPSGWVAQSGGGRFPLVPPAGPAQLTTRVGRHLNCLEYPLASRAPELARLPHVGTMLQPASGGSCLQSWSVTLVFDSTARPPRLVAAVYDQWEW